MASVESWEEYFVREFIVASKRDRYLGFLKGAKHRQKVLERLNHSLDYDPKRATPLPARFKTKVALLALLRDRDVADSCRFIADANAQDGKELRIDVGVGELLNNHFGALIICPYRGSPSMAIVAYKAEDPSDVILLS